jgi:hypothetical protein
VHLRLNHKTILVKKSLTIEEYKNFYFNETKYGKPVIVDYTTYATPSSSKKYSGSWALALFLFSLLF